MPSLGKNQRRRWLLFGFAFLSVSLCAGLAYGWPALRQDLRDEGSELSEKELGAIFTAGAWSTQGGRFLTGLARDRYGTRLVTCAALLSAAGGALGIALCDVNSGVALGVSLFFIGLGSGVQLCLQPVASLFPKHAGSILSSLSGAFQVSGLVFLALANVPTSRRGAFIGFVVCLLALTVIAAIILPMGRSFLLETDSDSAEEESTSEIVPSPDIDNNVDSKQIELADPRVEESKEPTPTNDENVEISDSQDQCQPTALRQIRSIEYFGLATWFSVLLVPLQYYVGSIGFQLENKGDENGRYTDIFAIVYAGAALVAPLAGYLADTLGLGIAQGLATALSAMAMFILASSGISLNAHVIGLVSYGIGRMLVFSTFFTNVGKRFGYSNYGTLAGLGLLTSAIVSLLQYPLIALAADGYDVAVNVACGAALVATLPYCVWLYRRERILSEDPA